MIQSDAPISSLGLWPSVTQRLKDRGVTTVAQLVALSAEELDKPWFRISRIWNVRKALAAHDLALRGDDLEAVKSDHSSRLWPCIEGAIDG